ncbi:hypothetical protein CA13_00540 [Planctomycetes bacterium CA13]|uniref:Plasmid stabilization system protein n=1 Tax=Novipirellula herctigrandis TaxID=2527986 RepID=A0A5C5YUJ0_9BACT|nr:hypothetical protein CA13_00540 [Planctomycetes bacterium CA13]
MLVELRPEASDDLVSAAEYFNDKSLGWGDHFLESIESDLLDLEREAGIHALHHGMPCKFASVFPFAIYYRIETSVAMVYAILSCRMDPGVHMTILKDRG